MTTSAVQNYPIITPDEYRRATAGNTFPDAARRFYSSGDPPKQLPFSETDLEALKAGLGAAMAAGGLDETDEILAAGAPPQTNHMSGWGAIAGAEHVGATVRMDHRYDDLDEALAHAEDITAVTSLPRGMLSLGREIANEYGDPTDVFPNLRLGLTGGDRLTAALREELEALWGFEEVDSMYMTTEAGGIAAEDGNGDHVPVNDALYLEVLEAGTSLDETGRAPEETIHAISDLAPDESVTGPLLVSAPGRDVQPLYRYRQGDVVTAYNDGDGPRIRVEGREDDVINMAGHHLYPSQIESAVRSYDLDAEWRTVLSHEDEQTVMHLYLIGADPGIDMVTGLQAENETIETWYDGGGMQIEQHHLETREDLAPLLETFDLERDLLNPRKDTLVGFDASYRAAN